MALHVAIMMLKNTVCIATGMERCWSVKGTTFHSAPLRHQHVHASSLHSIINELFITDSPEEAIVQQACIMVSL